MSLPNKHVTSLLLLCATHALAFPFYMDVGGLSNTTLLSPTVPNVEYHHIFECPHPCGLVSHFDKNGTAITVLDFYGLEGDIMGSTGVCVALLATCTLFFATCGACVLGTVRHQSR